MQKESVAKKTSFFSALVLAVLILMGCGTEPQEIFTLEGKTEINGSDIFYKRYAIGVDSVEVWQRESIVVVHGGPVMDHSYFIPHLDALAKEYQLFFYDQRASGRSDIAIDTATMNLNGFVEDIELLRKEMNLGRINLLGHSWGGLIAMKYGIKYASNLRHLVLSSSMAPNVQDWQTETSKIGERVTEAESKERQALIQSGALGAADPRKAVEQLLLQSFTPQMYDRSNIDSLKLYVPIDFMQRSQVYQLLGPDMGSFDLYPDLERITCPVLMVYGETEPATSIYTDKIMGRVKNAELAVIDKSGHFPFIEQPESYAKVVLDFLKK